MNDFLESYELYHHGIPGQKWGVRRYQYQDRSLTPEGRRHYGIGTRISRAMDKGIDKAVKGAGKGVDGYFKGATKVSRAMDKGIDKAVKGADGHFKGATKVSRAMDKGIDKIQAAREERKHIMKDYDKEYMKQLGGNKTNDPAVAAIAASSKMVDKYGAEKFNKAYKQQQMINTGKFALGAALAAAGTIALEAAYLRS